MTLIIGSADSDHLLLALHGWTVEQPENHVDAGWINATLEVVARPFSGSFSLELRLEALRAFGDELKDLVESRAPGEAVFETVYGTPIGFKISVPPVGRVWCSGTAIGNLGQEAEQRLDFRFAVDVAVAGILRNLDDEVVTLPPRLNSPRR